MFRSMIPRLSESAQMPDLTWNVSFLEELKPCEDAPAMLSRLLVGFFEVLTDAGAADDVNILKGSGPAKSFIGTEANGSTAVYVLASDFGVLTSDWAIGSEAPKKSNVAAELTAG